MEYHLSDQDISPSTAAKSRLFYGYIIVLATFCITLVAFGIRGTYGIFFNPMAAEFGWGSATVSSVFSLSVLTEGTFGIILGKINDRFGPRLVLTFCSIILGAGYLLMSRVNVLWQMYFFYGILVGIGMGGIMVPLLSTISRWFVSRRAIMAGIGLAGTGIGSLIFSPLSEWLISNFSWQKAYLVMGIALLVVSAAASQFLKRDPTVKGLTPYLSAAEKPKSRPDPQDFTLRQAARTRPFWLITTIMFINGYICYSLVVHLVPHVTLAGISPAVAAALLAIYGIAGLVGRIIMGGLADKLGNKLVFVICFILSCIIYIAMLFFQEIGFFYLVAVLFGLASGGMLSTIAAFVAELFGLKSHGEIFGVIGFSTTIGGAVGPFLAGYLYDVTGDYSITFMICAILCAAAIVFTALVKPIKSSIFTPISNY
jgi:MFS family permease